MPDRAPHAKPTIGDLFPQSSRVLLTGSGKQFIEEIGVEATKRAVLSVMLGENLREQTEPLTRRRVSQIGGALVTLFLKGGLAVEDFTEQLTDMAVQQIQASKKSDKVSTWPAQWLIGLTGKSDQNVLRSDRGQMQNYITKFEAAIEQAATKCQAELGNVKMTLGFSEEPEGRLVELGWKGITRLITAIGSQTLTIRGSDKSIYGKLFERLVLGTFLTILGFRRVDRVTNTDSEKVFWLSDSSRNRESDATLLLKAGKLVQFDIGFIGIGNPEISKDKLSRYEREFEDAGNTYSSVTFVIVDKLPANSTKTREVAEKIGAEIIQMSMQYWPKDLAQRLGRRTGFEHELQTMPDDKLGEYLEDMLSAIPIQDFLSAVSIEEVQEDVDLDDLEEGAELNKDELI